MIERREDPLEIGYLLGIYMTNKYRYYSFNDDSLDFSPLYAL